VDKAADFATRLLLGGLGGVSVPAPIPAAPAPEI
jgi:hypothetical protein